MASGQVITNNGKNLLLKILYGVAGYSAVSRFKAGTGTATPAAADADLQTPVLIAGAASKAFTADTLAFNTTTRQVTVQGFLASTECNGNVISEVGEVNTDGTPVLFSRDVLVTPISKDATIEMQITWTHVVS